MPTFLQVEQLTDAELNELLQVLHREVARRYPAEKLPYEPWAGFAGPDLNDVPRPGNG